MWSRELGRRGRASRCRCTRPSTSTSSPSRLAEAAARPAGAARPRRVHLLQGGRRQAAGRLRSSRWPSPGAWTASPRASASTACPRTSITSSRSSRAAMRRMPILANAGIQTVLQRPGELHARRPLPARRDARAARPVRRRRLQLDRHPVSRAAPARCWPTGSATAHPPVDLWDVDVRRLHAVPEQPHLPARPHDRDPRPALRHALAVPAVRDRARRAPLAVPRPAGARPAPCFGEAAGWERPNWFAPPGVAPRVPLLLRPPELVRALGRRVPGRARRRGACSTSRRFAKFLVEGADALRVLNRVSRQRRRRAGRPDRLHAVAATSAGGIEADLTVTRLAETRYPRRHRCRRPDPRPRLAAAAHPGRRTLRRRRRHLRPADARR